MSGIGRYFWLALAIILQRLAEFFADFAGVLLKWSRTCEERARSAGRD